MERSTEWRGEHAAVVNNHANYIDRLALYEDTGLEPEEIKRLPSAWMEKVKELEAIGDIDRLRELAAADKEGHLVVLPCKVGDTVYKICPISTFLEIGDGWDGRIVQTDCQRCPYYACDCHDIGYNKEARNVVVERKMTKPEQIVRCMPYFGTIYFLTREAAEAEISRKTLQNEQQTTI